MAQMVAAQVAAPPLAKITAWFMSQLLYCCSSQLSIKFKVDLCTFTKSLEMFRSYFTGFLDLVWWEW